MPGDGTTPAPTATLTVDLDALSDGSALDRLLRGAAALRAGGTAIIAVADGRRGDVIQTFPDIRSKVDALIYEHGCVAGVGGRLYPLAKPVSQAVGAALRRSGVPAVSGQVAILIPRRGAAAAQVLFGGSAGVDVTVEAVPSGAVIVPASTSPSAAVAFVAARLGLPIGCASEACNALALRDAAADSPP